MLRKAAVREENRVQKIVMEEKEEKKGGMNRAVRAGRELGQHDVCRVPAGKEMGAEGGEGGRTQKMRCV